MINKLLDPPTKTSVSLEFPADGRCDRCGSKAYIQARRDSYQLLFCAHHGRGNVPALVGSGWTVIDHTWKLWQEEARYKGNVWNPSETAARDDDNLAPA